jgi:predicted nucleic acid-binding protein
MKLVIDTNILISALIKNSVSREIIMKSRIKFYYPSVSLNEIHKYRELIMDKSGLSSNEYSELLRNLLSCIHLVREDNFDSYLDEANSIIGKIDDKDVVFVACALAINADGIYSEDRDFERQNRVRVFKTRDVLDYLTD